MPVQRHDPEFPIDPVWSLQAIAPGPTRILATSAVLPWQGLCLEKHLTSPGERISASINHTIISLNAGSAMRFEHRSHSGGLVACMNRPGTVMTTPPGQVPDMRLHTSSEFLHCALDTKLLSSVVEECDGSISTASIFRPGVQDKTIRCLLGMLKDELETNEPMGCLYVESLAFALASRYLNLPCGDRRCSREGISPLPPRILSRVRDKMEAHLDTGVSLTSLAKESGYSRAHFLRMFHAATGMTPHQYVLDLRLKRAQDSLRHKDASIVDIALSCGFSSQSHMTSVFRRRLEVTPAEFRRNPYSAQAVA